MSTELDVLKDIRRILKKILIVVSMGYTHENLPGAEAQE